MSTWYNCTTNLCNLSFEHLKLLEYHLHRLEILINQSFQNNDVDDHFSNMIKLLNLSYEELGVLYGMRLAYNSVAALLVDDLLIQNILTDQLNFYSNRLDNLSRYIFNNINNNLYNKYNPFQLEEEEKEKEYKSQSQHRSRPRRSSLTTSEINYKTYSRRRPRSISISEGLNRIYPFYKDNPPHM